MSEAPERMWATIDGENEVHWWLDPDEGGIEYVRADVHAAAIDRAEVAEDKLGLHEAISDGAHRRARAAESRLAEVVAERDRLREALTPSGDTKAAYSYEVTDKHSDGRQYTVSWVATKEIMKMIRARTALAEQNKTGTVETAPAKVETARETDDKTTR